MSRWEKVRAYLGEAKRDCIQLKKRNDLTAEGRGMLIQIQVIENILGERL